jgi:two-component system, chemotaxis family, chemotaxis protein CheY
LILAIVFFGSGHAAVWDLPVLNGMEVMRTTRSPGMFPRSNLPTIILTNIAKRSHVLEAMRVGVHEFIIKPTSPKAVCDRLISVMIKPRAMMKIGKYYVPKPRRMSLARETDLGGSKAEVAHLD